MEDNNSIQLQANDLKGAVEKLNNWKERASKALVVTGKLKAVTSQEDIDQSNKYRKALLKAYNEFSEGRKDITRKLDEVKKELMVPETMIKEEGARLKKLEEQYLTEKDKEKKAKEAELKAQEDKKNELAKIEMAIKSNVEDSVPRLVSQADKIMRDTVMKSTKSGLEKMLKSLDKKIELKESWYNGLFAVEDYNKDLVSQNEFDQIVEKVKGLKDYTHEYVRKAYADSLKDVIKTYKSLLPDMIEEMKDEKEETTYGELSSSKKVKEEADKREAERQKEREELEKKRQEEMEAKKMENSFESQVAAQDIDDVSGRKVFRAYIGDEKNAHKVIYQVMLECMKSERFGGIVARDKNKFPKKDDRGRPVYVDGVQYWLNQIVRCVTPEVLEKIDGLEVEEDIISVAK